MADLIAGALEHGECKHGTAMRTPGTIPSISRTPAANPGGLGLVDVLLGIADAFSGGGLTPALMAETGAQTAEQAILQQLEFGSLYTVAHRMVERV